MEPKRTKTNNSSIFTVSQIPVYSPPRIMDLEGGGRDLLQTHTATTVAAPALGFWTSPAVVETIQKVSAELIGTYILILVGCGSVAVNSIYGKATAPGVAVCWGFIVTLLAYSVGHVSGAHFNPAVTLSAAFFRGFPIRLVPWYIVVQVLGSILASWTLELFLDITPASYFATAPAGSAGQSLFAEIVATFILLFVISAVSVENSTVGDLGPLLVGMTILMDVLLAGPISGASMNPARSIGPAVVGQGAKALWVYIVGPLLGAVAGSFVYNLLTPTQKSLSELTKTKLRSPSKN
ncbi:Probable aquaporin NIP-type [Linum perenne]